MAIPEMFYSPAVSLSTSCTRLSDTAIVALNPGGVWPHDDTCPPGLFCHRIYTASVVSENTVSLLIFASVPNLAAWYHFI